MREVVIADAIALAVWIGWMIYCNVRDSGSWPNLLLVCTLWITGVAATLLVLLHYLVMLMVVAIILIVGAIGLALTGGTDTSVKKGIIRYANGREEEAEVTTGMLGEKYFEGKDSGETFVG